MSSRTLPRLAAALAAVVLFSACSSDALGPEADLALPTSNSEGGVVIGEQGPSFTLSLPATLTAGQRLSRTISFGSYEGEVTSATVNYGDGGGTQGLSVQRTCPYALCEGDSWDYSVRLSHVYSTPGTYTVTVKASDGSGTRTRSGSITIEEDPNIYIEGFTISEPAVQGERVDFSFSARGPGEDLFEWSVSYGTGLTQKGFIPPGGTRERSYTWEEAGTYELTIVVSNDTHSDTFVRTVVVEPAPVTIGSVEVGSASEGETVSFGFVASAPPGIEPASVTLSWGDGTAAETFPLPADGVVSREHVWAETGLYTVEATVTNGVSTTTVTEEVTVRRPPPAVADFSLPAILYVDGPSGLLSFRATDAEEGATLAYRVRIRVGEVEDATGSTPVGRDETVELPLQASQGNPLGEYEISVILESLKNGVLETDSVAGTIDVREPIVCEAGSYWADGACLPAPVGSYVAVSGATEPTECAIGEYQDLEGQTSCKPAPAGTFVNITGATEATPCQPGTVQDQTGQYTCYQAAPGTIAPETGLEASIPCEPGTFQPSPGQVSCIDAEPGHYVAVSGATDDVPCELGTFAATPGQVSCAPAPAGSYVDVTGATQATLCAPGSYQDRAGQRYCHEAPAGSFVANPGAVTAELCPAGTFQPSPGQMVCFYAQPGSFATGPGATASEVCPLGAYQPEEGASSCLVAPVDTYVDIVGAIQPTACPTGTGTVAAGSTSSADCLALGEVALVSVDEALAAGTLTPVRPGRQGERAVSDWVATLERGADFFERGQHQAGCAQVRNAYRGADGKGGPPDVVTGPARADIAALLLRILEEEGC